MKGSVPMRDSAWIFIADKDSWLECARIGSFGLQTKPGRLKEARAHDPVVAYIKGESIFAGIGRMASEYYYDTEPVWPEGVYPHRVKIAMDLDFDNAVDVRYLIDSLDFITDKTHWSVRFRGGVVKIPYADYETIKVSIEKQKEKTKGMGKKPLPAATHEEVVKAVLSAPELTAASLHNRLAEMIHVVGLRTGYDSIQEYKTRRDSPYEIDVAWMKNRNPQIAVEIHHGGNLGDALDRLRHARDFNFRKVVLVIVEPTDHRRALDILKFDEKLKHVIDLWSVKSVYDMYVSCLSFHRLYSQFEESAYKEEPDKELA